MNITRCGQSNPSRFLFFLEKLLLLYKIPLILSWRDLHKKGVGQLMYLLQWGLVRLMRFMHVYLFCTEIQHYYIIKNKRHKNTCKMANKYKVKSIDSQFASNQTSWLPRIWEAIYSKSYGQRSESTFSHWILWITFLSPIINRNKN